MILFLFFFTVRKSSCRKVMFSQASVILSTGGLADTPRQTYPWADPQAPPPPPRQTPLQADDLEETATAADGMHPTGLVFFLFFCFVCRINELSSLCSQSAGLQELSTCDSNSHLFLLVVTEINSWVVFMFM